MAGAQMQAAHAISALYTVLSDTTGDHGKACTLLE